MRLRSSLALLVLPFLLVAPSLGQDKVQITADDFTLTEATHEAIFTGNVLVVHPSVTVKAAKVVATYGDGGTSDIETFEALGNVTLTTPEQTATGERAVFNPADQLLRLTGNVRVVNATGTVDASELVVNLATNTSTFTSGGGGRVTGVFSTQ